MIKKETESIFANIRDGESECFLLSNQHLSKVKILRNSHTLLCLAALHCEGCEGGEGGDGG